MNFMPISVTKLEPLIRLENSSNRTSAIVNCESHCSINHLENQIIFSALDGQQDAGNITRFDLHGDVKVQTDSVPLLGK